MYTEMPYIDDILCEAHDNGLGQIVYPLKVIGLNNGREMKYYIAPESEGEITVPEILEFMQIQAEHMVHDTTHPRDYNAGYRDAIEAIYLFIKKRIEEDSKKKDEFDANCC